MKEKMLEKRTGGCVSFVKEGALVLSETEVASRGSSLLYRLSVEPRTMKRKSETTVFYTVTVERERKGERTVATLRDFSCSRQEAEAFYRLLVKRAVSPEHLNDIYDDYVGNT